MSGAFDEWRAWAWCPQLVGNLHERRRQRALSSLDALACATANGQRRRPTANGDGQRRFCGDRHFCGAARVMNEERSFGSTSRDGGRASKRASERVVAGGSGERGKGEPSSARALFFLSSSPSLLLAACCSPLAAHRSMAPLLLLLLPPPPSTPDSMRPHIGRPFLQGVRATCRSPRLVEGAAAAVAAFKLVTPRRCGRVSERRRRRRRRRRRCRPPALIEAVVFFFCSLGVREYARLASRALLVGVRVTAAVVSTNDEF